MKKARRAPAKRARTPRWLAQIQEATRLVAMATEARGKERHRLLVDAAKIFVAVREPRVHRLTFERSSGLLERAIAKLSGEKQSAPMRYRM